MIKANFNAYDSYVTDSLYQWDLNQVLSVSGLNLSVAPEVHFANANMDKAIVKQAELINHVVKVQIPNSLLQEPLTIKAYIGIYEADTFKIIETVSIPVKPKAKPSDYRIENTDEEIYSFEALKNAIANMVKSRDFENDKATIQARIDNIIAHNNNTNGNSELVDMRLGADGKTYNSAGQAVRKQFEYFDENIKTITPIVINENITNNDRPSISYDITNGVYNIHIPALIIAYGKERVNVVATDISYTQKGSEQLHYICYNFNTSSYEVMYWADFYYVSNKKYYAVIGICRLNTQFIELNVTAQYNDFYLPFVSVILGRRINGEIAYLPIIDLKKGIFTFPDDTILRFGNGYGAMYALTEDNDNTTCDFSSLTTTAINIVFDTITKKMYPIAYNDVSITIDNKKIMITYPRFLLVCSIRTSYKMVSCTFPYVCDGYFMGVDLYDYVKNEVENTIDTRATDLINAIPIKESHNVKGVNHRGYNYEAPECTLSAYKLSKKKGFKYVECDVSFTSDNIPVILHDASIDRTSNGTGNISDLTLEQVKELDFGSWFSSDFTGETIPTFEEFILLCKNLGLHPYIEIKASSLYTPSHVETLVNIVKRAGMIKNVTWISFEHTYLSDVQNYDNKARLGYITNDITDTIISRAVALKNDVNEVFIDASNGRLTDETIALCINADLPLEVWTVNGYADIRNLNPYITGVTSDNLIAGDVLINANLN